MAAAIASPAVIALLVAPGAIGLLQVEATREHALAPLGGTAEAARRAAIRLAGDLATVQVARTAAVATVAEATVAEAVTNRLDYRT